MTRILFVGDIMGSPGRRAAAKLVAALRSSYDVHLVIINGENAAGGLGITRPTAQAIRDAGADVITLGNHAFAKRDIVSYLDEEPRLLRPANYPPGAPGAGYGVFMASNGANVAVVNLVGRTFMEPVDCPFRTADAVLAAIAIDAKPAIIIVDVHAEATSEKMAMGWHLGGRVSAVVGTHTHVQTSDERILPGGTAYITDVGMTGVRDSVLGLNAQSVIEKFITKMHGKFVLAEGKASLQAVIIDVDDDTGRAIDIQRLTAEQDE